MKVRCAVIAVLIALSPFCDLHADAVIPRGQSPIIGDVVEASEERVVVETLDETLVIPTDEVLAIRYGDWVLARSLSMLVVPEVAFSAGDTIIEWIAFVARSSINQRFSFATRYLMRMQTLDPTAVEVSVPMSITAGLDYHFSAQFLSGPFLGVRAGVGRTDVEQPSLFQTGILVGVTAGYQWIMDSGLTLLLSAESDYDWTNDEFLHSIRIGIGYTLKILYPTK